MARPMLMRLSEITPSPTQRFIPASPLWRQRLRPCRRFTTLMRPSHPVRHFWPLRNQRFFCSRRRSALLVERLGDGYALDAHGFGSCFVLAGIEASVGGDEVRHAAKCRLMDFDRRNEQVAIV